MPPIRVQHIDHVTLVVTDLDASQRFYCDLLGMEDVPRPNFSFDGRWFQAGATQIHLIKATEESGLPGNLEPESIRSTRSHHLAFQVDDARAAAAALEGQVPFVSPPKQRPDGAVQAFVQDPDGHIVELCSPPQ
jgi:catechol 2,3-dioxygenase-like lactoylglutathione lyase family enzyme